MDSMLNAWGQQQQIGANWLDSGHTPATPAQQTPHPPSPRGPPRKRQLLNSSHALQVLDAGTSPAVISPAQPGVQPVLDQPAGPIQQYAVVQAPAAGLRSLAASIYANAFQSLAIAASVEAEACHQTGPQMSLPHMPWQHACCPLLPHVPSIVSPHPYPAAAAPLELTISGLPSPLHGFQPGSAHSSSNMAGGSVGTNVAPATLLNPPTSPPCAIGYPAAVDPRPGASENAAVQSPLCSLQACPPPHTSWSCAQGAAGSPASCPPQGRLFPRNLLHSFNNAVFASGPENVQQGSPSTPFPLPGGGAPAGANLQPGFEGVMPQPQPSLARSHTQTSPGQQAEQDEAEEWLPAHEQLSEQAR